MDDGQEEPQLKRYTQDMSSPLERFEHPEGWREQRLETLREVIKGPSTTEDWHQAHNEYLDLKNGGRGEIEFGR